MKESVYYIGVLRRNKTAVFQAVRNVDFLDCEIALYYGPRVNTKSKLREDIKANKDAILQQLRKNKYFKDCKYITVE